MIETPSAPVALGDRVLELLAEIELLRRKTNLLDTRLVAWESHLRDVTTVVDGLLAGIDTTRDPEARLRRLESQVDSLIRRRSESVSNSVEKVSHVGKVIPDSSTSAAPVADAIAVVLARWCVGGRPVDAPVEVDSTVELIADADGIPPGVMVPMEIHPLDSASTLVRLSAESNGDRVRTQWAVPAECAGRSWCFTARFQQAVSTSAPLYVA